jgi:hypothetical protein
LRYHCGDLDFTWGGVKDTKALFHDLSARVDNKNDNGLVDADGVAMADKKD